MRDSRREYPLIFQNGLDLESSELTVQPGVMRACKNFEVDKLGGYTRIEGYERFDGQLAPSEADNETDRENRRAAISQPPGVGPVRGVYPFKGKVYCFRDQNDNTAGFFESSSTGWIQITTPTRTAGGRYEFAPYNFKATASTEVLIGTDGINPAFIWDGSTFTEISIPGESDPPTFCAVISNYLFLGMEKGILYYSVVGEPTDFDSTNGAGAIGAGGFITNISPLVGGGLAVLMRERVSILQGNGPSDWSESNLRNHDAKVGGEPYTAVLYNQLYYLDERGITNLAATEAFGSFASLTISAGVNSFITDRQNLVQASALSRRKNQLRWLFNPRAGDTGSEVLSATFNGNSLVGYSLQKYDHKINVIEESVFPDGSEVMVAGTNDGWVMRMDKGNSFDGEPIEAYIRTPFIQFQSPQKRKKFLNLILNIETIGNVDIRVKPEFSYSSPDLIGHPASPASVIGGGGFWGEDQWNEFKWSAQLNAEGYVDIAGTGKNLALTIYNKSDQSAPFTIYETLIYYIMRNWYR